VAHAARCRIAADLDRTRPGKLDLPKSMRGPPFLAVVAGARTQIGASEECSCDERERSSDSEHDHRRIVRGWAREVKRVALRPREPTI
jgi:hypothetical protein